jgi:ABC-type Fe3+/spermidine/putrescine transport system ATPase subunit
MFQGKILQTGTPRELYEQPTDISVARFLGRHNFIRVMRLSSMKNETGEFKTLEGGHKLHLPVQSGALAPLNKPCILAIRPEHVVVSKEQLETENALPAVVREIQFAGATTTLKLDANGLVIEALLLNAEEFSVGESYAVVLPTERLRLLKE